MVNSATGALTPGGVVISIDSPHVCLSFVVLLVELRWIVDVEFDLQVKRGSGMREEGES